MSIEKTKLYLNLVEEKKDLEAQLKEVKKKASALESELIEFFQASGIQKTTINNRTIYLRRQLWASLPNKETAHIALEKHGYGDLIEARVMPQRLSAWVRELLSNQDITMDLPLPADLAEEISVTETFQLRTLKG